MTAVTIVTVAFNSAGELPRWIDAVLAESGRRSARTDVLVVDNGSSDTSGRLARGAGIEVVTTGRNLGYAAAIDVAYDRVAESHHMLILNPDAVLHPGCVDELVAELQDPSVGLVVPRLVDHNGHTQPSLRRFPTPLRAWGEALLGGSRAAHAPALSEVVALGGDYGRAHDIEWATGAAVLVSAAARHRLGRWDATYFLYSEETEYMMRAQALGVRTRYRPTAVVTHTEGDMMRSPGLWAFSVRNRIALFRRRHSGPRSVAYQVGVALNDGMRSTSAMHRAGLRAALNPGRVPGGPAAGIVADLGRERGPAHDLIHHIAKERPILSIGQARGAGTPAPPGLRTMKTASRRHVSRRAAWYLLESPHLVMCDTDGAPPLSASQRSSLVLLRGGDDTLGRHDTSLLRSADVVCYLSRTLMARESALVGPRARLLRGKTVPARARALLDLLDGLGAR